MRKKNLDFATWKIKEPQILKELSEYKIEACVLEKKTNLKGVDSTQIYSNLYWCRNT